MPKTINLKNGKHCAIPVSGLARSIACPGSIALCADKKKKASYPMAEGTIAHKFAEQLLLSQTERFIIDDIAISDGFDVKITQEMYKAITTYVQHCYSLITAAAKKNHSVHVEQRGSLGFYKLPQIWGTSDFVLSVPEDTLYIRDYKHGAIPVYPENNPPLMTYALIAAGDTIGRYKKINIGIVQPRGLDDTPIKIWETTPEKLMDFAENILYPTVKIIEAGNAPILPGEEQCRWCEAKGFCSAHAAKALTIVQSDFKNVGTFVPNNINDQIPTENIANIYKQLPILKQFISAIEMRIFNTLNCGEKVNGYKLVHGRRARSWINQDKVEEFLSNNGVAPFEEKILSPAKAEKLLTSDKKKELTKFIQFKTGKPVIVAESDKREPITTAVIDFANEFTN